MSTFTQQERHLALATILGPDALLVRGFSGSEAISRPFMFDLDLLSEIDSIDLKSLRGSKVTLRVGLADGSSRHWNGHIGRITQGWKGRVFTAYRVEMVPWLWFLGLKRDCRIFQEKNTPTILKEVFTDLGFQDFDFRLHGDFPSREYCVQYRETDLQFVCRLMEEEGIYYFFEHEEGKHVLVMANTSEGHPDCPNQSVVRSRLTAGAWRTEDVITDWRLEEEFIPSSSALADYNFITPTIQLGVALKGETPFEIYDHPGLYPDRGRGQTLARLRLEETSTFGTVAHGESNCRSFTSGFRFKLDGHYRTEWNEWYVLTEVRHHGTQGGDLLGSDANSDGSESAYRNDFVCIPYSTPFRPPRHTPLPVVEGCQTAVVVGPEGEEIYTDEYGRVKVQFHWDRQGRRDEKSSCWIRVSQNWAGQGWGAISNPRIGQEVIVDFLEGNPDRPIIIGRVYNANMMPPYALPANQTQTGIKSRSTKSGGASNFNEIQFEDRKGEEEVYIHAERNLTTIVEADESRHVGHDRSTTIGNDENVRVKGHRTEHVDNGHETITIHTGNRTVNVNTGHDMLSVKTGNQQLDVNTGHSTLNVITGNRDVNVPAGTYALKAARVVIQATTELTLQCGGGTININSGGIITITGPLVKINC